MPRVAWPSDRQGRISLAAFLANTIDLKGVAGGRIMVPAPDLLLKVIHFSREKFHRTAALRANHMMMAAPVVLVLVPSNAVMKRDFAGQAAFGQQFERAINRSKADAAILFLHETVQFIGRKVIPGFEKGAQDRVPLGRLLETHPLEMPVQDILRFANHFAGNRRLVINALLQHGDRNASFGRTRLDAGPDGRR